MSVIVLKTILAKSTNNVTKNWIHGLEEFRKGKFTEEKIEQITSVQELDKHLITYITEMKQKMENKIAIIKIQKR